MKFPPLTERDKEILFAIVEMGSAFLVIFALTLLLTVPR